MQSSHQSRSNGETSMRGHLRKRRTWEYILELGPQPAQRCQSCGRRHWVEGKARKTCPACAGELKETSERRQRCQAGFATRKVAAGRPYHCSLQPREWCLYRAQGHHLGRVPPRGVATGRPKHHPLHHLFLLQHPRQEAHPAHPGSGEAAEADPGHDQRPLCSAP